MLAWTHGIEYERLPLRRLEPLQEYVLTLLLSDQHGYLAHDAELGWSIKPGGSAELYSANAQGLRADREFDRQPPAGRVRIATFGDSFTHGDDVAAEATWQSALMGLDERYEVMNFGVPSYGPGQALLRYRRESERFDFDWVALGLLSENVHRAVNTFRPFYRPGTGVPLAKPRFVLRKGALELIPNPMPERSGYQALLDDPEPALRRLGDDDYYYQLMQRRLPLDFLPSIRLYSVLETRFFTPSISRGGVYADDSEALVLTRAIVDAFREDVRRTGARPLVILYPTSTDLRDARAGQATRYGSLQRALCDVGRACVDVLSHFRERAAERPIDELIRLHNTELGNQLVAEAVLRALRQQRN